MSDKPDIMNKEFALTPHERAALNRKSPVKRGYAWQPGTGPQGETCGTCKHLFRNRMGKTYLKCSLMEAKWTGGAGTDILARSPACKLWEKP